MASGDPKGPFSFRSATDSDVDAMVAIEREVYGPTAWSRETVRRELVNPHTNYIVAEAADIAGYGGVLVSPDGHRADIQTITIVESWRRRGLGRLLATKLLSRAEAHGAREVFLEVRDDNPRAHVLYRSLGFDRVGVHHDFSAVVEGATVVVMRRSVGAAANATPHPRLPGSRGVA